MFFAFELHSDRRKRKKLIIFKKDNIQNLRLEKDKRRKASSIIKLLILKINKILNSFDHIFKFLEL